VTERVHGPGSPLPLEHPHHAVAHCSAALGAALIKQEMPELVDATRPDSSTAPGDENNNSSRPTSAFGQLHPGMPGVEQPAGSQPNPNMLSVVQVIIITAPSCEGARVFNIHATTLNLFALALSRRSIAFVFPPRLTFRFL
jgi:hypothetical protein